MMTSAITPDKLSVLDGMLCAAARVCIVTHFHPDGDAMGGSAALKHYLASRGKEATIVIPSAAPRTLDFIAVPGTVTADSDPAGALTAISGADLIIAHDFNDFRRTESLSGPISSSKARKVLIDHHLNPSVTDFDLVFSETEVSSASELLYWILLGMPGVGGSASGLPQACLTPLLTGMTTDTNNFANSVFPSTLMMASGLLEAGADRNLVLDNIYCSYGENRIRLMGYLMGEVLRITPEGVAYIIIDNDIAERFGICEGDTEGFVNMPLAIARVRMSILLREDGDHFRVSIRSKSGVSANALAQESFHGGGHTLAAGGRLFLPGDIAAKQDAASYIENVTARFMQNPQAAKTER